MPNSTMEYKDNKTNEFPSRSSRNSRLYREVYGKYEDLDNLPIEDNTEIVDIARLREIVYNSDKQLEHKELREYLDVMDVRKRNIDTKRVYDINEMLEKAKYENNKLKEPINVNKHSRNILSTLEIDMSHENEVIEEKKEVEEENIYMTREFKFKELNDKISELNNNSFNDDEEEEEVSDSELSLDLFEDLKPVGNTIITKPIVGDNSDYKGDMHSEDTRDIDIIKPAVASKKDEFFTNSYEFSKKDFNFDNDDDDFFEKKKGSNVGKILLLVLAILVFSLVIVYFVLNYGIGV